MYIVYNHTNPFREMFMFIFFYIYFCNTGLTSWQLKAALTLANVTVHESTIKNTAAHLQFDKDPVEKSEGCCVTALWVGLPGSCCGSVDHMFGACT